MPLIDSYVAYHSFTPLEDVPQVEIWDVDTHRLLHGLDHFPALSSRCEFTGDGSRLFTAGQGGVKIWDVESGEQVGILGQEAGINSVSLKPDGTLIATGGQDGMVRIWDGTSHQELLVLAGHGMAVVDVEFSPDGKRVASASMDDTVRIWAADLADLMGIATERLSRDFTDYECDLYRIEPCVPNKTKSESS